MRHTAFLGGIPSDQRLPYVMPKLSQHPKTLALTEMREDLH
jgi:hypothetical protein